MCLFNLLEKNGVSDNIFKKSYNLMHLIKSDLNHHSLFIDYPASNSNFFWSFSSQDFDERWNPYFSFKTSKENDELDKLSAELNEIEMQMGLRKPPVINFPVVCRHASDLNLKKIKNKSKTQKVRDKIFKQSKITHQFKAKKKPEKTVQSYGFKIEKQKIFHYRSYDSLKKNTQKFTPIQKEIDLHCYEDMGPCPIIDTDQFLNLEA